MSQHLSEGGFHARRSEALELLRRIQDRNGIQFSNADYPTFRGIAGISPRTAYRWWNHQFAPSEKALRRLRQAAEGPPRNLFALLYDMYRDEHGTTQEATP